MQSYHGVEDQSRPSASRQRFPSGVYPIPEKEDAVPPAPLTYQNDWLCWRYKKKPGRKKPLKVPIDPQTGDPTDANNPSSRVPYIEAIEAVEEYGLDGIGYVPTWDMPILAIDLDNCRDPETGEISEQAWRIVYGFNSYTEISPSGTGLRIFALADKDKLRSFFKGTGKIEHKNGSIMVEVFAGSGYVTYTGNALAPLHPVQWAEDAALKLCKWIDRRKPKNKHPRPRQANPVPLEDCELLDKARNAANGKEFIRLYDQGDASKHPSKSEAHLRLFGMLAFWTRCDPERMDRLFRGSAFYRDKAKRQDYRDRTIAKAIAGCTSTYSPKPRQSVDEKVQRITEELEKLALADPWRGRSGPRDRFFFSALLNTGGVWGKACAEGVIVTADSRKLALECGTRQQGIGKRAQSLQERGWLRVLEKGGGKKAAKYLLLARPSKVAHIEAGSVEDNETPSKAGSVRDNDTPSKADHIETLRGVRYPTCVHTVEPLWRESLPLLRRIRDAAPLTQKEYDKNGRKIAQESKHLLRSMGGFAALVLEKVAAKGHEGIALDDLSSWLDRRTDNVKRTLELLEGGGFVAERGGRYYVPEDLADRLRIELEDSGCEQRERMLRERYEDDRARRDKLLARADKAKTRSLEEAPLPDPPPEPAPPPKPEPERLVEERIVVMACELRRGLQEDQHGDFLPWLERLVGRGAQAVKAQLWQLRDYAPEASDEDLIEAVNLLADNQGFEIATTSKNGDVLAVVEEVGGLTCERFNPKRRDFLVQDGTDKARFFKGDLRGARPRGFRVDKEGAA